MPQPDQTFAAIDALHARKRSVYAGLDEGRTYAMLAAVQAGLGSLHQLFSSLANCHDRHAPAAPLSGGGSGRQVAVQTARILTDAAALTSRAGTHVDAAWARNGRDRDGLGRG